MKQYGFRHKILLLAVALVFITQLVMLVPVLDLISDDSDAQADRTVGHAKVIEVAFPAVERLAVEERDESIVGGNGGRHAADTTQDQGQPAGE